MPKYKGKTWGDLVNYSHELSGVIHRHNADKLSLQRWVGYAK